MKPWAKWTAKTVLLTTGFAAAGGGLPGVAFAGTAGGTGSGGTSTGNASVLSGNHVKAPVSIPVGICGNAAAILGVATASCEGGAAVASDAPYRSAGYRTQSPSTADVAIGHGNTVKLPVKMAANACGNSVGNARARCHGTVTLPAGGWWAGGTEPADGAESLGGAEPRRASLSAGNLSIGSGNDVESPVSAPVNICGNAAAVLGDSSAGCVGGATVGDRVSHSSSKTGKVISNVTSKTGNAGKTSKTKCCTSHPTKAQLAGLGALPGVATVPGLGDVTSLSPLEGLTGGGALMPASTLSAYQQTYQGKARPGIPGGGMSGNSFVTLAVGALLAGAAALKLASRRPRVRRAGAGQAPA